MSRSSPIRVLALSPIPEEGAGCRFRIAQYLPYLEGLGYQVTIRPFYTADYFALVYKPGHFLRKSVGFLQLVQRRRAVLRTIQQYDLVWLYREAIPVGPPLIERAIARRGIPMVLDFDDAIFLPNVSEANRAIGFLKNPRRVAEVIGLSRRVVVGNSFLAEYARRYSDAVSVVPTAVDTAKFVLRADAPADAGRELVVGWIGSPTTFPYLRDLAGVLAQVAGQHRFRLRVSGAGQPVRFPGVTVDEVPWSLAGEVNLFNTCDIGVYPLTDDDWSRGKCGFKAIQCMACGVPVVAAAVGVNREIITDGVDSFLAATPAEWIEKLGRLLTDPGLRASMAAAGRRTIEERYSLQVTAPRLARILAEAVAEQT